MKENIFNLDKYLSKKFVLENNLDYDEYEEKIIMHNKLFINRKLVEYKDYFDDMFKSINPKIVLDNDQRTAILTDEDYNLIVAGAGSGKTTTMTAKIKYMIEKCNIPSSDILAISFARKNVKELDERLNKDFKLNVKTMTFHSLGNTIIKTTDNVSTRPVEDSEKYNIMINYLKNEIQKNPTNLKQFIHFLYCYFDGDKTMDKFDDLNKYHEYKTENLFKTLKGKLNSYNETIIQKRKNYRRSINDEYLRSNEEVMIANFLYLNGIDYVYEPRINFKYNGRDYRPDFLLIQGENKIYLEHFGISEDGKSSLYNNKDLVTYKHNIRMKEQLHKRNSTVLIKTFSKYNDDRPMLDHLKEELIKHNFVFNKRSEKEIFYTLADGNFDSYFYNYLILLLDFISQFKLNCYQDLDIDKLINKANSDRTRKFLITAKPMFLYYEQYLKENGLIDFEEMITKAAMKMDEIKDNFLPFEYKYIIIDEYQDISKQRYDLIKKLSDYFQAKIIAVGDDWQSIFAFAGSDVDLFSKFEETMGYGEILKIRNTYRNAQELIDTAGEFVQKDDSHIKKQLISNKHIDKPIVVYSYDDTDSNYEKALAIAKAINDILDEKKDSKILLIGRYNFDLNYLCKSGLFEKREGDRVVFVENESAHIEFFTVHKSKGLEFDNTIIINAINSTYGFPSKIKDDPIFEIFDKKQENMAYAEERRLFYVALTRTKNKVYIIVPKSKPSLFVLELDKNKNVLFKDDTVQEYKKELELKKCPSCNSPLKLVYDNVIGSYVYRCVNEKEMCSFYTNELKHKIPIRRCPDCDGYLMLKKELDDGLFIGCTNYNEEYGCKHNLVVKKKKRIFN